jgi:hypothetical protein
MRDTDIDKGEDDAYIEERPNQMMVQDALIALATYALQIDITASPQDAERIAMLAWKHPLFQEDYNDTLLRVNKFANDLGGVENPNAIIMQAAISLTRELRELAWEWVRMLVGDTERLSPTRQQRYDQIQQVLITDFAPAMPENTSRQSE